MRCQWRVSRSVYVRHAVMTALLVLGSFNVATASNKLTSLGVSPRIAALAPSLTELVFAAGAGEKLVAVSAFSDHPPQAQRLPRVSDYSGINIEALLSTRPDVVLVWASGTREKDIERITALGISTFRISIQSLDDVQLALQRIGALAGSASVAKQAAEKFAQRAKSLEVLNRGKSRVSVFFEVGNAPLMTVNANHFISEVIRLCGGVNIFADVAQLVFQPSREQLLQKNPDVILFGAQPTNAAHNRMRENEIYAGLRAVQRGNVLPITADYVLRPGPRLLDAADEICRQLDTVRNRPSLARGAAAR